MSITLADRLKIADEILARRIADETMILNMKTGVFYCLDPIGTRFFDLLRSTGDLQEVYRQLLSEYDVSAAELEADLLALCDELQAKGISVLSKP
jgi:hypothetical protein